MIKKEGGFNFIDILGLFPFFKRCMEKSIDFYFYISCRGNILSVEVGILSVQIGIKKAFLQIMFILL